MLCSPQVEQHFGTDYHVEKMPEGLLEQWRNCGVNAQHRHPAPNDLIDRDAKSGGDAAAVDPAREKGLPELFLLLDRIRMRCWHLPAAATAKSFFHLKLSAPELSSVNAKSCAVNSILVFLVRDAMTEFSYVGELAGIFYRYGDRNIHTTLHA